MELYSWARPSMSWISSSFSVVWPFRMLNRYLDRLEICQTSILVKVNVPCLTF